MIPSGVYETLNKLYNGKDWAFNGDDLSGLDWRDTTVEFDETLFLKTYNSIILDIAREKRNTLLDQTDKYIVADYPHATPEKKQEWLDYRQALRELPSTTEDPENPVWPVRPDEVTEENTSNVVAE